MGDFYIVLPSNACAKTHPVNNASKYVISWEKTIEMDERDQWTVALTEANINYNLISVTTRQGIEYDVYEDSKISYTSTLDLNQGKISNFTNNAIRYEDEHTKLGYHGYDISTNNINTTVKWEQLENGTLIIASRRRFEVDFGNEVTSKALGFMDIVVKSVLDDTGLIYTVVSNKPAKVIKSLLRPSVDISIMVPVLRYKNIFFQDDFAFSIIHDLVLTCNIAFNKIAKFSYKDDKIEIELCEGIESIKFLKGLQYVLGFPNNYYGKQRGEPKVTFKSSYPPQLYRGLSNIYIYASVCSNVQVGETSVPLLRSIWLSDTKSLTYGEVVNLTMKNPMYIPVSQSSINSIEINLRDDSGELVSFAPDSVTSLTLHFRKHG